MAVVPLQVAIQNLSTALTDVETNILCAGLNKLLPVFCADWNQRQTSVVFYNRRQLIPPSMWRIYLLDTADTPNALGYHDVTNGIPYGKVFVRTILRSGGVKFMGRTVNVPTVAQCLSHELFELLLAPYANTWWSTANGSVMYAGEVSDPVQGNIVPVSVGTTQIGFSDWVLPKWTDSSATKGPFNHTNSLKGPFQVDSGGYLISSVNGVYTYVFGNRVNPITRSTAQKDERIPEPFRTLAFQRANIVPRITA
jgi:hypothetical protein